MNTETTYSLDHAARLLAGSIAHQAEQLAKLLTAHARLAAGREGIDLADIDLPGPLILVLDEHDDRMAVGLRDPEGKIHGLGSWPVSVLRAENDGAPRTTTETLAGPPWH